MRATIVVTVEDANEIAAVETWFARWASQLHYRSEDLGCGCCVQMWNVDAPAAAVAELPAAVCAGSEWSRGAA